MEYHISNPMHFAGTQTSTGTGKLFYFARLVNRNESFIKMKLIAYALLYYLDVFSDYVVFIRWRSIPFISCKNISNLSVATIELGLEFLLLYLCYIH